MKTFCILFFIFFFALFTACNDDDDTTDKIGQTLLTGTWNGESYVSYVPDGLNEGKLSGKLVFEDNGTYNSSLSPFQLNAATGNWSYDKSTQEVIFNAGKTNEEIGKNVAVSQDSLEFTVYRGAPTNQTVVIFKLIK